MPEHHPQNGPASERSNLHLHLMNTMRTVIIWIIIICGILPCTAVDAQPAMPDSTRQEIERERSPEKKVDKYLVYINRVASISPDEAIALEDSLIRVFETQRFSYGLGRVKSLKAWHLILLSRYEASLKLAHEALAVQKNITDSLGIGLTLLRIGMANLQFKRYRDSEKYSKEALAYFVALRDSSRIDAVVNNLGVLASEEKKIGQAISFYKQSLEIRTARKDSFWMAYSYLNIGDGYLRMNRLDSAAVYLLLSCKVFKENTPRHKVPPMVHIGLGELYQQLHDYPEAIRYTQEGLAEAIKTNHVEMIVYGKKQLGELLFETGKYREAYLVNREYLKLKTELDSANNIAQVTEIEERYKNAEREAQLVVLKNEKLDADNKAQRSQLYALVISLVSLALIFVAAVVLLRKQQQEKIKRSEFQAKISESKMLALRAQMNPHFIFNCINTAQHFIMNMQKEKAYEYLASFARLLRMVLENSHKTFVPLEDELAQLRLYIELEAIRFVHKFTYTIAIDPRLEDGVFEVPGMILQPIIENAIGHGLINRNDDQGKLSVIAELSGEHIIFNITDNGVGRARAQELKGQKKIIHHSTALSNINERLKTLQAEASNLISIELIDLFEEDRPSGTQVKIVLPYR